MMHRDETPLPKVLVCLGDSITYGFPYGPESSWVHTLQGQLPVKPLNRGVNGDSTWDMLRRLPGELGNTAVSHVHILGGINDAFMGLEPDGSRQWVDQMVQMCITRGAVPILGLTTPLCMEPAGGNSFFPLGIDGIVSRVDVHRTWLKEYAATHSISLIDYFTPLCLPGTGNGNPLYFLDEAHLSPEGNRIMAAVAVAALNRIIKLPWCDSET